jgi:hypothetical protein
MASPLLIPLSKRRLWIWLYHPARLFDDADEDRRVIYDTMQERQPACLSAAAVPVPRPLRSHPELGRLMGRPVLVASMH